MLKQSVAHFIQLTEELNSTTVVAAPKAGNLVSLSSSIVIVEVNEGSYKHQV